MNVRDYNFFEVYEKKKGININPKSTVFVCAMLLLLVVAVSIGLIIWNLFLSYQIEDYTEKANEIKASENYQEADKLEQSINAMNAYDKNAEVALEKLEKGDLLGTEVMAKIASTIPAGASINSLNMNNAVALFAFSVPDRRAAAELLMNMKETAIFSDVHLASVSASRGGTGLTANIQCILKEKAQAEETEQESDAVKEGETE